MSLQIVVILIVLQVELHAPYYLMCSHPFVPVFVNYVFSQQRKLLAHSYKQCLAV